MVSTSKRKPELDVDLVLDGPAGAAAAGGGGGASSAGGGAAKSVGPPSRGIFTPSFTPCSKRWVYTPGGTQTPEEAAATPVGDTVSLVIFGEVPSMKNSREIVQLGGRPASIKSVKARAWEAAALRQVATQARRHFIGPVGLVLRLYYASERPDMDEALVLDVLQDRSKRVQLPNGGYQRVLLQRGIYSNDRQVRERHVFHGIDRSNPRVEVEVWRLDEQGELG